jgi:hypothetical protein
MGNGESEGGAQDFREKIIRELGQAGHAPLKQEALDAVMVALLRAAIRDGLSRDPDQLTELTEEQKADVIAVVGDFTRRLLAEPPKSAPEGGGPGKG